MNLSASERRARGYRGRTCPLRTAIRMAKKKGCNFSLGMLQ